MTTASSAAQAAPGSGPAVASEESGHPGTDPAAFRRCLGQFATGVTVITARVGDGLLGMTANSFSSVSLDPPLILRSAKRSNASFPKFEAAAHFALNVLSREQIALSKHFGKPGDDKFKSVSWTPGLGGAPLLDGCVACFQCRRAFDYPGGDHLIILGEVEHFARSDREALLFVQGRYSVAEDFPDLQAGDDVAGMPRPPGPMDEFLTALLYRAHGSLSDELEAGRRAEGLTLLQSRVLAAIQTLPGRTLGALLPHLFLGGNAAEETIAELSDMGLVSRDAAGCLTMTDAGRERNRLLLARAREIELRELSGLSDGDIAACRRVLRRLVGRREAAMTA